MSLLHLGPRSRYSYQILSFDMIHTDIPVSLSLTLSLSLSPFLSTSVSYTLCYPMEYQWNKLFSLHPLSQFFFPWWYCLYITCEVVLSCISSHVIRVHSPQLLFPQSVIIWLAFFLPFGAHLALFSTHTQSTVGPETVVSSSSCLDLPSAGLLLILCAHLPWVDFWHPALPRPRFPPHAGFLGCPRISFSRGDHKSLMKEL